MFQQYPLVYMLYSKHLHKTDKLCPLMLSWQQLLHHLLSWLFYLQAAVMSYYHQHVLQQEHFLTDNSNHRQDKPHG